MNDGARGSEFLFDRLLYMLDAPHVTTLAKSLLHSLPITTGKARENTLAILAYLWIHKECTTLVYHLPNTISRALFLSLRNFIMELGNAFDETLWRSILHYAAELLSHLLDPNQ